MNWLQDSALSPMEPLIVLLRGSISINEVARNSIIPYIRMEYCSSNHSQRDMNVVGRLQAELFSRSTEYLNFPTDSDAKAIHLPAC